MKLLPPEPPGENQWIGHYGCENKIIKVSYEGDGRKRPRMAEVNCPACGRTHKVGAFLWRWPRPGEALRADIALSINKHKELTQVS